MSRVPFVRDAISVLRAWMLDSLVTSRENVSMPWSVRYEIESALRAVANTRRPFCLNSSARAWPMPPAVQPVMRTDFTIGCWQ